MDKLEYIWMSLPREIIFWAFIIISEFIILGYLVFTMTFHGRDEEGSNDGYNC